MVSDALGVGLDAIHDWSQKAKAGVSLLFQSKNARRKIDAVGTGEAAGESHITYKSDVVECFTEDQCSWLDAVVGESIASCLTEFGQSFGRRVHERFMAFEQTIEEVAADGAYTVERVNVLEAMVAKLATELEARQTVLLEKLTRQR